jgi:ribosome-binding factor A
MNTPASRRGRAVEVIAREAAGFIAREAGDGSLITVVRAQATSHGDRVMVFVSIFPEEKARTALAFLERQREAFSDHLKTHTRLRPLPRVDFMLDNREGNDGPVSESIKS